MRETRKRDERSQLVSFLSAFFGGCDACVRASSLSLIRDRLTAKIRLRSLDRLKEEWAEFGKAGRDLFRRDLIFALPTQVLEAHHSHRPGCPFELVEDPFAIGIATLSEGGMEIHQLLSPIAFEIAHDGEEELGHPGCHGIDLGGIEESHGGILRDLLRLGKVK